MTNNNEILPCIEIEPNHKPTHTVIWLHGLGADGNDFAPVVPELHLPESTAVRFIFPHAPVMPITINHGYQMRAWYDIVSFTIEEHMDRAGMFHSRGLIEQLIARENDRGIASKNIFIGGFSQGAVIAFLTGLSYQQPLAGVLGISGYLPFSQQLIGDATADKKTMPIFIGHGTHDPVVPYYLSQNAHAELSQANFNVIFKSYPIPHSVNHQELFDISMWLQAAIKNVPNTAGH